ncbi:serine hydrolase domain-containing protein [Actinomadura keratinilytica]|uniref:serine hydrolase domain-containing protein n=1 Tax=Actinomadura keratinilytica TaxID=547461 RepID=UPI00361E6FE6
MRIGSNTKTFVAATVMQLVGEGKVKLDEPIDTYLPGVVEGPDYDGKKITVRNLLGHTSGLPDYTEFVDSDTAGVPSRTYTAEELLEPALKHKAAFPVGKRRRYSNTNYIVAGMLVTKVTGKPVGEAVTERVINRLGLRQTYWPRPGDKSVRKPRMEGYVAPPGGSCGTPPRWTRRSPGPPAWWCPLRVISTASSPHWSAASWCPPLS